MSDVPVFPAISKSFVNQYGKNTLRPLETLISKSKIVPFQVVWKSTKRRFRIWEKISYTPTPFQITDLLTKQKALKTKPEVKLFTGSCKVVGQYSLNGSFGGSLKPLISGGVSGRKNVILSADLGRIQENAVDIKAFRERLPRRKLNMKDFHILSHKNDVLCVVTNVLELVGSGKVSRDQAVQGNVAVNAEIPLVDCDVHIDVGASVQNTVNISLPKGTPLAYELHELGVTTSNDQDPEGTLELIIDGKGGFFTSGGCMHGVPKGISRGLINDVTSTTHLMRRGDHGHVPIADQERSMGADTDISQVSDYLGPIHSLHQGERSKITGHLLQLMSAPNDIHIICIELLEKAEDQDSTTVHACVSELQKMIITPDDQWIPVLLKAGFVLKEDELIFRKNMDVNLRAYGTLFDALDLLEDEDLENIRNVSPKSASTLLAVMANALQRRSRDEDLPQVLAGDTYAMDLLLGMGFGIDKGTVTVPVEPSSTIDLVYCVVSALWGTGI